MSKRHLWHFISLLAVFWAGWKLFPDVVFFDGYISLFLVSTIYFIYQELMIYGANYFYRVTTYKEKSAIALFETLAIPIIGIFVLGLITVSTDTFTANGFLSKFFLSACCFTVVMGTIDDNTTTS